MMGASSARRSGGSASGPSSAPRPRAGSGSLRNMLLLLRGWAAISSKKSRRTAHAARPNSRRRGVAQLAAATGVPIVAGISAQCRFHVRLPNWDRNVRAVALRPRASSSAGRRSPCRAPTGPAHSAADHGRARCRMRRGPTGSAASQPLAPPPPMTTRMTLAPRPLGRLDPRLGSGAPCVMLRRRVAARGARSPSGWRSARRSMPRPRPEGRLIWLHAASLGEETVSILPVVAELAQAPGTILLTTGTVTSQRLLAQRLPDLGLGEQVIHRFVPLDVPAWGRALPRPLAAGCGGFRGGEARSGPNILGAAARRGNSADAHQCPALRPQPSPAGRWRRGRRGAILGWFHRDPPADEGWDGDPLRAAGARSGFLPAGNLKLAAPAAARGPSGAVASLSSLNRRPGPGSRRACIVGEE